MNVIFSPVVYYFPFDLYGFHLRFLKYTILCSHAVTVGLFSTRLLITHFISQWVLIFCIDLIARAIMFSMMPIEFLLIAMLALNFQRKIHWSSGLLPWVPKNLKNKIFTTNIINILFFEAWEICHSICPKLRFRRLLTF